MTNFETIIIIVLLVLMLAIVWMLTEIGAVKKLLSTAKDVKPADSETLKLQLQAYERLTVLSDRIALQNLLTRLPYEGLSSKEMQVSLIKNIKQEYEYNISQQIYIEPEIWKAIDKMKEQNIYIINQLASTLPPNASAMDLNKQIIEFVINNPKTSLHGVVHDAINYEAKKLM